MREPGLLSLFGEVVVLVGSVAFHFPGHGAKLGKGTDVWCKGGKVTIVTYCLGFVSGDSFYVLPFTMANLQLGEYIEKICCQFV